MLFRLAGLIRHYTSRWTLWLLDAAFAIDQISEGLLEHVRRHYWRPVVLMTFKRNKRGAIVLRFKNLEK